MLCDHLIQTNVHCCSHLMQIKWLDNICFIYLLLTRGKGKKYSVSPFQMIVVKLMNL